MSNERQSESPSRCSLSFFLSLSANIPSCLFLLENFLCKPRAAHLGCWFLRRGRANLVFTCDIHRKGFLHNKFSGSSGCVMAGGAARWRRERERWSPRRAQSAGWKGFSIIGALRNTRCMMWLIFYYLQIKTEKVEPRRKGERKERYRVEAGCHHWEIAPAAKEILRRTWHSGKWKQCQSEGGNLTLSHAFRMRKGQNRSIFQFAKRTVQEDRVITGNIPTELFSTRSLCHTSQVEKEWRIFIMATSRRLLFPAC
jgi:hypothetical protein